MTEMHLSVSENKHEKDTAGTGAMLLFSGALALRIQPPFCLQSQYKLYYNMFPCVMLFSFGVCGRRGGRKKVAEWIIQRNISRRQIIFNVGEVQEEEGGGQWQREGG